MEGISFTASCHFGTQKEQYCTFVDTCKFLPCWFLGKKFTFKSEFSHFVAKLPGYDFSTNKGYQYKIEDGVPTQLVVSDEFACIVNKKESANTVECKKHDLAKSWKVVFTTVSPYLKIGVNKGIGL